MAYICLRPSLWWVISRQRERSVLSTSVVRFGPWVLLPEEGDVKVGCREEGLYISTCYTSQNGSQSRALCSCILFGDLICSRKQCRTRLGTIRLMWRPSKFPSIESLRWVTGTVASLKAMQCPSLFLHAEAYDSLSLKPVICGKSKWRPVAWSDLDAILTSELSIISHYCYVGWGVGACRL